MRFLSPILLFIFFFSSSNLCLAQQAEHREVCRKNLKRLAAAIKAYGIVHQGKIPEKLSLLYYEGLVDKADLFICPGLGKSTLPRTEIDSLSDFTLEPLPNQPEMAIREKGPNIEPGKVFAIMKNGELKSFPVEVHPAAETVTSPVPAKTRPPNTVRPQPTAKPGMPVKKNTPSSVKSPSTPPPFKGGADTTPRSTYEQNMKMAAEALQRQEYASAKELYGRALKEKPDSLETIIGYGQSQNITGDINGAIVSYLKAYTLAPEHPNLRTWLAELYIASGDIRSASNCLTEELTKNPNSAWAHSWLGTLYAAQGNEARAAESYARAMALDPQTAAYRHHNGSALRLQYQCRRAIAEFSAASAMDPRAAGSYFGMAACEAELGQTDRAILHFRRCIELGDSASPWVEQAKKELARLERRP